MTNVFISNDVYPGQYYDQESGLHYNYFRDYDPKTGRYVEADPIGLAGGMNLFTYVANRPIRFSDPTGLAPVLPGDSEFFSIPDYDSCRYYGKKCKESDLVYYCKIAPFMCRNADIMPLFWLIDTDRLNCIRNCLVREDQKKHEQRNSKCETDKHLSDKEIDDYHNMCFSECDVSSRRYPGINPWWIPFFNPNAPNAGSKP